MNRPTWRSRLAHAWNAFRYDETKRYSTTDRGLSSGNRPDRIQLSKTVERSIIAPIFNRIATDIAAVAIKHVRTDDDGIYLETINDSLNQVLTVESNKDQTGRALISDISMSLMDEGEIAIIPTETSMNPNISGSYDIHSLRVGEILEWYPDEVRVRVYNEDVGVEEDIVVKKKYTCIIENPFYAIMNEPNSTLKRLVEKINLIDVIDSQNGSNKLDLIIQLPFIAKSKLKRAQADKRKEDIDDQLENSKYGIAYIDATEKITQLNRSVDNNLLEQIEYLTKMLYAQLGLTNEIMNGSADEAVMLNYYNRTVEPFLGSIIGEMHRKFLTKTARSQNQAIMYFIDMFKLMPIKELAELADRLTRNEIFSSNEIRGILKAKPSKQPNADVLRNKNMPQQPGDEVNKKEMEISNGEEEKE